MQNLVRYMVVVEVVVQDTETIDDETTLPIFESDVRCTPLT